MPAAVFAAVLLLSAPAAVFPAVLLLAAPAVVFSAVLPLSVPAAVFPAVLLLSAPAVVFPAVLLLSAPAAVFAAAPAAAPFPLCALTVPLSAFLVFPLCAFSAPLFAVSEPSAVVFFVFSLLFLLPPMISPSESVFAPLFSATSTPALPAAVFFAVFVPIFFNTLNPKFPAVRYSERFPTAPPFLISLKSERLIGTSESTITAVQSA